MLLPLRGLSLPRPRGRRSGGGEALDGSGVAVAPLVVAKPATSETPLWLTGLLYFGPTLLFFLWLMRRAGGAGGGMLSSFGRAKAKQYEPTKERVSFDDVAGIEEAEQELAEVVDFLRDPTKYRKLGARIPRGVLLSGRRGGGQVGDERRVAGLGAHAAADRRGRQARGRGGAR